MKAARGEAAPEKAVRQKTKLLATKGRKSTAAADKSIAKVRRKIGLMVIVRDLAEARQAVKAGANLLLVSEPARGSMGMAPAEIAEEILEAVGRKVPVAAALGEWSPSILTEAVWHLKLPLQFVLWGLAGYREAPGWGMDILDTRRLLPIGVEVMAVAYVDHLKAKCVPTLEVIKFVKRYRFKAILLDTFAKDGKTLLNYLNPVEIAEIVNSVRESGIRVALGGDLTLEAAKKLAKLTPDWFAVRGSVCLGGKVKNELDPIKLSKWRTALG